MTSPTPLPETYDTPQTQPRWRARGLLYTLLIVIAAGLTGAFVGQAMSEEPGWGGGWGHGGWMSGPPDPARIEDRADRIVRHLAIEIDATTDQETKLRTIVKSALTDLMPLVQQRQAARQQMRELLTGPTVDRAALEKFRADHLAMWDTASKRIAQAVGDAAEVLSPEQRQKLAQLMAGRKGFWHRWGRG